LRALTASKMPRNADIFCLGISHRTAALNLRERFSLTSAEHLRLLSGIRQSETLAGLVMVSTCNRVEFYGSHAGTEVARAVEELQHLLGSLGHSMEGLEDKTYALLGLDAARHLARVGAGLDAMVLGEAQILGQLDAALRTARDQGAVDEHLENLFRFALKSGRRARAETQIGHNAVSVSSVAVRKVEVQLGTLSGKTLAIVGLGEAGRLVAKLLRSKRGVDLLLINRTLEIAMAQAERLGAEAQPFSELAAVLSRADAVFMCTGCPYPLIEVSLVRKSMALRPDRPLVLVDLAVPHDIDPAVSEVAGVTHYDVDSMQVEISDSLSLREAAIPEVEAILGDELARFERWLQIARVQPLITDLRRSAEDIRRDEVARLEGRLPELSDEVREHIERFSRSLVQKLFHHPTEGIREGALEGEAEDIARTVRNLFQLRDAGS
jgi:glutamyl-tRNA reductase